MHVETCLTNKYVTRGKPAEATMEKSAERSLQLHPARRQAVEQIAQRQLRPSA